MSSFRFVVGVFLLLCLSVAAFSIDHHFNRPEHPPQECAVVIRG